MYLLDTGVTSDNQMALEYYRKAAKKCYAPAQANLETMFYSGTTGTQDIEKAQKYFLEAAQCNHGGAMYWLSLCYKAMAGLDLSFSSEAQIWLHRAHAKGVKSCANCYW